MKERSPESIRRYASDSPEFWNPSLPPVSRNYILLDLKVITMLKERFDSCLLVNIVLRLRPNIDHRTPLPQAVFCARFLCFFPIWVRLGSKYLGVIEEKKVIFKI